jgi:hypothetical protein
VSASGSNHPLRNLVRILASVASRLEQEEAARRSASEPEQQEAAA